MAGNAGDTVLIFTVRCGETAPSREVRLKSIRLFQERDLEILSRILISDSLSGWSASLKRDQN